MQGVQPGQFQPLPLNSGSDVGPIDPPPEQQGWIDWMVECLVWLWNLVTTWITSWFVTPPLPPLACEETENGFLVDGLIEKNGAQVQLRTEVGLGGDGLVWLSTGERFIQFDLSEGKDFIMSKLGDYPPDQVEPLVDRLLAKVTPEPQPPDAVGSRSIKWGTGVWISYHNGDTPEASINEPVEVEQGPVQMDAPIELLSGAGDNGFWINYERKDGAITSLVTKNVKFLSADSDNPVEIRTQITEVAEKPRNSVTRVYCRLDEDEILQHGFFHIPRHFVEPLLDRFLSKLA